MNKTLKGNVAVGQIALHVGALLVAYIGLYILNGMAKTAAMTFSYKPYMFASIFFLLLLGAIIGLLKPLPVIYTGIFFLIHLIAAGMAFASLYFAIGGTGLKNIVLNFGFDGLGLIYVGLFFVAYYAVMSFKSPDLTK